MFRVRDKYSMGIIAGLIANTVGTVLNYISYYFGLTKYLPSHIASATFLPKSKVNCFLGLTIGLFADYGVAIFFGITITYLLYYTGTDYMWLKGISVSLLYWLLLFGMGLQFGLSKINPSQLNTNLIFLIHHILLGIIVVWVISKYDLSILDEY
ncbi:hypothetical protein [Sporohalobacter salinus]|uniref:hypothetical protein n=1 Tax=Sporohalobacter salinus TaxID=1494606 RepID=UPI001960D5A1|nr:hypothetical protein [Sporohalobacter salinus]MBM7625076.1 hypothetical protein [Sporohalobacter salinus]